jgi:hypothetical protein
MLPALERLPETGRLIEDGAYFVVHAARQSGKTTLLQALTREVNASGRQYALYCSLETLQGIGEIGAGMPAVAAAMRQAVRWSAPELRQAWPESESSSPTTMIGEILENVCQSLKKPLVLFFDEADCLSGQVLISFLRQLRNGYVNRGTAPFPWSLALVGMRDIRDFKAKVRTDADTLGSASPFNVVAEALTLVNFTAPDIGRLYRQHTESTGQTFEPAAMERAWHWSEGQPWLVNALARQVVDKELDRDYSRTITAGHIDRAAETLMKRRDTHIDSLLERLKEPRVRKVVEPVLFGGSFTVDPLHDDTRFCLDLGLLTADRKTGLRPANPIYRDVMVRTLNYGTQFELPPSLENRWMDGKTLDLSALLREFQRFWRENAEAWVERYEYREAAPHLILQAFLQRVVNGGAEIEREFALGRGRVDLCLRYAGRNYPVELKLAGNRARERGLEQLAEYMDSCGAREGWLVIFDRTPDKPWEEKISWDSESLPGGRTIQVAGC